MSIYKVVKHGRPRKPLFGSHLFLGKPLSFTRGMVSRRKILSRSRDDLNLDQTFTQQEEEEDVWYQKDKLFKEHIQEVLDKWTQIDDEIWAKVIVFERNRRVAKAYARTPVLTINGSDDGFDGMRIGLCGFDNPMRDPKTEEMKRHIGQGVKIKMDDAGNILVRRYSKSNVYVKSTASSPNEETAIGAEILKLPNQTLESEKIVKLFDMKKFQSNVNRELRRAYPDRRRLETQCLSAVAFVKSENEILECPVWVLIINVVAMDMLKSKLPPVQRPMDIKNRPRIPIPDEDPYSVASNSGGSSGSSGFGGVNGGGGGGVSAGHVAATREQLLLQTQQLAQRRSEKPPKLPPRDNFYPHDIPKPDYDDSEENRLKTFARGKSDKGKDNKKYDDPYYCGLRARVPNFVKTTKPSKEKEPIVVTNGTQKKTSIATHLPVVAAPLLPMHPIHQHPHIMATHQHNHQQQMMWHARSYESGIGIYSQMNYMLDHPFNCPYRDYIQNLRLIDKTVDSRGVVPPPSNFMVVPSPYLRNCNDYFLNSRPTQPKCELHSANKWHSESDIFDLDKDESDMTRTHEKQDLKLRTSLPLGSTVAEVPLIPRTSFSSAAKKKFDSHIQKTKLALTKSDTSNIVQRLEKSRRKSTSTDSFFRDSLNNQNCSDQDLYDKVKSSEENFFIQKKTMPEHKRSLGQKDPEKDNSQDIYSAEVPAVQLRRRGRSHSRMNDNLTRERSLYDYRSSSSKLESDMESIYGYLKPRKSRNHGMKQFVK